MSQVKKFGTFAGVYTPSLLTILGVIMYMRLGWVVGNAGLYSMLAIIIVSHIISFSTGLSISSIATDKRIKTGGIYYILSRSLGLPMGGSIGITLAVGTALSISLYIIGFVESFLSLDFISNILHLSPGVEAYRIVGTIVVILLVVIAFISTSFAIKAQFFIFGAIILSLISIFIGFHIHADLHPAAPLLHAAPDGKPLSYLFAIFFPAVTGFTAGVAMSGDLKDPKKDIPIGTMAAIISGFIVYIVLAIAFAFFVNRDLLVNNFAFLTQVAWIPALIFAGIWGATLSSALGGILGGPRILQAVAQDNILPKIIAKGHGKSNEPRNALILVFFIAEAGILIGELNVIAGVVSMFYLAAYGFINMAFALESWASTDFRPSFKVPRWVGVFGAIASFMVMFFLDPLSMAVAFIIMWVIFFLLKRKELKLDFGDVWQSVWSGIVRTALLRLKKQEMEERNWRPNIILFSGGADKRQHLLELGKAIVGKLGLLSNFDLIQKNSEDVLYSKIEQNNIADELIDGVFMRQHSVDDVYEGIEIISSTYGFSGIEPNTVLLGWARQTENPERFAKLIDGLSQLDLNVLLVDYDKNKGYGKYKTIDIWWENNSKDNSLSLKLAKFISNSKQWESADIRLQVVNTLNKNIDLIKRNATNIFEELRLDVELRIINNEIEQKDLYQLILSESSDADLIFISLPDLKEGQEADFVQKTNELLPKIGSVVLIRSTSKFNELSIGLTENEYDLNFENIDNSEFLRLPTYNILAVEFENYFKQINSINNSFFENFYVQNEEFFSFFNDIGDIISGEIDAIVTKNQNLSQAFLYKKVQNNIYNVQNRLAKLDIEFFDGLEKNITTLTEKWTSDFQKIISSLKPELSIVFTTKDLNNLLEQSNNVHTKRFVRKAKGYIKILGHPFDYKFQFAKFIRKYNENEIYQEFINVMNYISKIYMKLWLEVSQIVQLFNSKMLSLERYNVENDLENINKINAEIKEKINLLKENISNINQYIIDYYSQEIVKVTQNSINIVQKRINISTSINSTQKKEIVDNKANIDNFSSYWRRNNSLLIKNTEYNLAFERLKNLIYKANSDTKNKFKNSVISSKIVFISELIDKLNEYQEQNKIEEIEKLEFKNFENQTIEFETLKLVNTQLESISKRMKVEILKFPKEDELLSNSSYNEFSELFFSDVELLSVKSSALINYIIEVDYVDEINTLFRDYSSESIKVLSEIGDTLRIIPYSIKNLIGEDKSELKEFVQNQVNKLNFLKDEISENTQSFDNRITQIGTNIHGKLSLYNFNKIAQNYRQYLREQAGKRGYKFIRKYFTGWRKKTQNFLNNIIYKRSTAVLFAKKLNTVDLDNKNKVHDLLKLTDFMSVKEGISEKIPFYYKQLFLGKENFFSDFWVGKTKELEEAQKALQYYNQGHFGGFLIVGEYNSGKSFFAQTIASKVFGAVEIYKVEAPVGGSISEDVFRTILQDSTGIKTKIENIFDSLAQNSVVILENVELWWQRSVEGLVLIEKIQNWIDKYSSHIKFIVTINPHSFEIIDKQLDISGHYLHIFQTKPFSAEFLRDAILRRHKASGLKLEVKKSKLNSGFDQAQFFSWIFDNTQGIIGDAFMLWLSSISDIDKEAVYFQKHQKPNLQILDYLSDYNWAIIISVILHREISLKVLEKQFTNKEKLFTNITFLLRSGVIVNIEKDIYALNSRIYPFIKEKLFEKELF